jgi:L-aspartate oxidase
VFGARVVAAITTGKRGPEPTGAMSELLASGVAIEARPPEPPEPVDPRQREAIEARMSGDVGVVRDADGLALAAKSLSAVHDGAGGSVEHSVAAYEVANLTAVASAIVAGATARLESRGSHTRADFPATDAAQRGRYVQLAGDAPSFVALRASRVDNKESRS